MTPRQRTTSPSCKFSCRRKASTTDTDHVTLVTSPALYFGLSTKLRGVLQWQSHWAFCCHVMICLSSSSLLSTAFKPPMMCQRDLAAAEGNKSLLVGVLLPEFIYGEGCVVVHYGWAMNSIDCSCSPLWACNFISATLHAPGCFFPPSSSLSLMDEHTVLFSHETVTYRVSCSWNQILPMSLY